MVAAAVVGVLVCAPSRPAGPRMGGTSRPGVAVDAATDATTTGVDATRMPELDNVGAQPEASPEGRKEVARRLELAMLDADMEATVTVRGQDATTLRIEYILCGKVLLRKLTTSRDFMAVVRAAGFDRLECIDGFTERVFYKL
jgi:hypothetical protein